MYQRALTQATASPTDRATRGFQYGERTRPIELREGLFWSYVDQDARRTQKGARRHGRVAAAGKQVTNVGPGESDYLRYYRLRAQSGLHGSPR